MNPNRKLRLGIALRDYWDGAERVAFLAVSSYGYRQSIRVIITYIVTSMVAAPADHQHTRAPKISLSLDLIVSRFLAARRAELVVQMHGGSWTRAA